MKLNSFEFNPKEDKELGVSDYILDAFAAPVRGLEGITHGVYNLGDFLSFDMLPDWDEQRFFGRSQTVPGSLIEGLTQFAVPFGAIGKGISVAGKAARAGKLTGVTGKAAKAVTKGAKPGQFTDLSWKGYLGAEMASDFVAFDGQEERLANLIQQFPELQNPVTEFLAADPDDAELTGRAKNVLEGVLVGLGVGAVAKSVMAGLTAVKIKNIELQKGADREDAVTSAMMKWEDETKDLRVADLPDFKFIDDEARLLREIETDKLAIANEERDLKAILDKEKAGETIDEWQKGLREDRLDKFKTDLKNNEEALDKLKARKSFEKQPELQEKLEEFNVDIEELDEVIATRPPPFQSYQDAGMLDIIPRGAEDMINRLMNKQPTGGASVSEVEDIQQFIKVIGFRMFDDVAQPMITNKIPSAGRYEFGSNLLKIRADIVKEGKLKRTMIHELWHSLSRYLPEQDLTNITKQFQRERNKYIQSFGIDIKDLESPFDPSTVRLKNIPKELEKFLRGKQTDFTRDNYRYKDIDEYFAEEMTDAWFKKEAAGELAPSGTPKRIAQEFAIFLKDLFESLKAKLGIDQRQKIFNDFLKQRNIKRQRQTPLGPNAGFAELPDFKPTDIVDDLVKNADVPTFRVGGKQSLTGLVKTMGKLPEGMYPQELAGVAEQTANKLLQDSTKMAKLSQEMLDEGVVNELADAMGSDGKMLNSLVQQASKDKQELFRITARMKALESMLTANGKEILNAAEQYKNTKGKVSEDELEMTEARLKTLIEQQLHIQASQSGLASGFGRGLKSRQMGVKIGLSEREIADTKLRQDYLNKRGGMTVDNIVENILLAKNGSNDDLWNTIIAMNKTVRGAEGGKLMDMIKEYYLNSIMFGPRTLSVNALGGAASTSIKNFERYIGGWITASPEVRQSVVNSVAKGTQITELVRFMLTAWKSGDHYIGDAGSAFVEQTGGSIGSITSKNVERLRGKEIDSDGVKQFIDYFGNIVRIPNRFNTSVDQMYKFNEYKTRAKAMLELKAYELGIRDSQKVAEYVTDSLNALITRSNRNFSQSGLIKEAEEFVTGPFATPADREKAIASYVEGRQQEIAQIARQQQLVGGETRDNDFMALEQLARDWVDPNIRSADEVTFSRQLGKNMQKLQSFVNGVPFGFIVAPFIRTPTNILKFSFSRLLAPGEAAYNLGKYAVGGEYKAKIDALKQNKAPALEATRKSIMEQMYAVKPDGSPDLLTRAEIKGKLATGTILNTALASTVFFYKDRINGGGPKDFKQRQAWQAAGNMPYSIRVFDKWISYQRLDPIATMIGVYADMADLLEDGKMHSIDANIFEKIGAAMTLTLTRNATNKSYLAGIDNFFKAIFDPESTTAGKYAGTVLGGFIPNVFNQGQSITGDQELKEARTLVDVITKRIPGVAMDLKRNPLGEPVVQEYFEGVAGIVNPLNPIMWGSKKNDPVLTELANVAHGFSAPSVKLEGVIDLTNYDGANNRSAYDRWLELHSKVKINNLTLRQALTKLINSKQYKSLDPQSFSGLPSPRVDYLRRVMSRYRQKAKTEMLKEFPEIRQLQQDVRRNKKSRSTEDVLELLQQTN